MRTFCPPCMNLCTGSSQQGGLGEVLLSGGELQQPRRYLGIYGHFLPNSSTLARSKANDCNCLVHHTTCSTYLLLIPMGFLQLLLGTMISLHFFQKDLSLSETHPHWSVKNYEESENSAPLQFSKVVCHSLTDNGRRPRTAGSQTKDVIIHGTASSMRVSTCVSAPRQILRGNEDGPR